MRVTCPQCQSGYDVDPEKIPADGLRVRCPQCNRVFSVRASGPNTLSGRPPAAGPGVTMAGAPPPPPAAGRTMVGMAPPMPAAPATQSNDPVPLPGRTPAAAPPESAEEELFPAPESVEPEPAPPVSPPPVVFTSPTGAVPLPAPPGGGKAPHWPPPEVPEPFVPFEPIEELVPGDAGPEEMFAEAEAVEEPPAEEPPAEEPPPPPAPAAPESFSFGEVPLDQEGAPDPFAVVAPRGAAPEPPEEELEMLFAAGAEALPPAPPPAPRGGETTYRIRRPSGRVFGPFSEHEIVDMLGKGELNGNEDVSPAGAEDWVAIGSAAPFAGSVQRMNEAPLVAPAPSPQGAGKVPAPFQPRMQGGFREKIARASLTRKQLVTIGVAAGALLLVVGVGVAGSLTRHGPFFWKAFRSRSDAEVGKLAAEGRRELALDAFASDRKAMALAQQGLLRRADDPEGIRLFTSASAALAARGGDSQAARARQLAATLVAVEPAALSTQESLLASSLASGEDAGASIAALEKVLPAKPDPETLFLLARASLQRGETARALTFLDRLDADLPGSARSARLRAAVAVRKGDDKGARAALDAAVAKDPGNAAAALDLAALLEKAGDPAAEPALRALLAPDRVERLGPAERARARILLAGAMARGGDLQGAEAELTQATKDWSGSLDARLELGRALLRRGEPVQAAAALEAIPAASRSPSASALLVRALLSAGKAAEASTTLDGALSRAPGDPDLLIVKGVMEQRAGRPAEARKAYETAAAKDPAGWQAPLALARLAAGEGDIEGAEAQLRIAVQKGPDQADVLAAEGTLALVRGDTAGAAALYARALERDPRNAAGLSGSARLALARDDVPGARALAERAVAADPASADAQLLLGWALWRAGETEPARKALEAALALDPRGALARVKLGALLLEQRKTDEAMKELDQATNLDARMAEAQFWLGKALLAKGEAVSAVDRLRRATQLAPGEAAYHVQLGEALERSVQVPEAILAYRAAIAAAPRSPDGYEHLGRLLASQGDCKQAMPQFQKALEVAPGQESARVELGSCQLRAGRAAEAVVTYQKALKGDPKRVDLYYLIARAVNEAQGPRAAVPWYEKASAAEPTNPMPHLYLGYWHKERGQRAQAVQEFKKYLAERPDADDKKDVEREMEDLSGKQ